jgi:hypothetical protein
MLETTRKLESKRKTHEGRQPKRNNTTNEPGGKVPFPEATGEAIAASSHPNVKTVTDPSLRSENSIFHEQSTPAFKGKRLTLKSGKIMSSHRFGNVMSQVPCRNRPRFSTVSIALPGSFIANGQTRDLRTYMIGQIARAATIFHVDEIVVYDDKLAPGVIRRTDNHRGDSKTLASKNARKRPHRESSTERDSSTTDNKLERDIDDCLSSNKEKTSSEAFNVHEFMIRILQYCECPQYLRRQFFPMHPDLQFAGLLPPVDAPHHVRSDDRCKYREGIVLDRTAPSGKSLVNCGIRNRPVE